MQRSLMAFLMTALVVMGGLCPTARGERTMIGRQSQNEGMLVVPAPGAVKVDGKLDEWDFSGRIWMFADKDVRNRFSGQVAAMWTSEALYLGIKWADPTPMYNMVNPDTDPSEGWKADSVQMRVRTADQISWLTTWFYTPRKQPVLDVVVWNNMRGNREGTTNRLLKAQPGGTTLGEGVEMAYLANEDGKGFTQEVKIPWTLLFRSVPEIKPDLTIQIGFELLWGDPTGKTFPIHRYADNLQPGHTSREFFWTAKDSWGNLKLVGKGKIAERQYVNEEDKITGTVPVRVNVPKDAARATIAINDAQGKRVRNLAGDISPEDYSVEVKGNVRTIEVKWDLLDDAGAMVPPGSYQAIGLTQKGLGAEYEMCFYNPGTPPWDVQNGSGAWGADHTKPLRVVRAGDWMGVSWAFVEGGHGIIGIGADGKKKWGEKRGAQYLAGDSKYLYAIPAGWHIRQHMLIRLSRDKGDYKPFVKDGQERPFELPLTQIIDDNTLEPAGLAANEQTLVMLLRSKKSESGATKPEEAADHDGDEATSGATQIVWLDKASASVLKSVKLPALNAVAMASDGTLYAMDSAKIYRVDVEGGKLVAINAAVSKPAAIAVDNAGNIVVADMGADQQIKAFSADGKLVYTCARKGGRAIRGKYDEQAVYSVTSVAVDAQDNVWAVESWNFPRRVSVWNPKDGTLVRDYIGNTGYAGTGCFLHEEDPSLAYVGPMEFKLDRATRTWKLQQILWVPDPSKGESFLIDSSEHNLGHRFSTMVKGQKRDFLFTSPYRDHTGYVVFMDRGGKWQPVSAITTVGRLNEGLNANGSIKLPPPAEFSDCNGLDAIFWNDTNRDGLVQRAECEIVKATKPSTAQRRGEIPIPMGSGWGERMAPDLSFYVNGIYRYSPVDFTDDGAPIYSSKSLSQKLNDERGDFVPVNEEGQVLVLSFKGNPSSSRVAGVDMKTGAYRWTYPNPFPGVHGSHRATMPSPGLIIGPLKICGVVKVNDEIGRVFLMRGNLGQDFLMTTDGLYVGAMFQDGRLPGEKLPNSEQALVGQPMEVYSHGSEPFNGWFGKHSDGVVRMTTGFPRQAAMILAINGLDSIRRFTPVSMNISDAQITQADKDNVARLAKAAAAKKLVVGKFETAPKGAGDWQSIVGAKMDRIGFPFKGTARLAYDDKNLYLLYEVEDQTPWKNEGKDFTRLFKTGDSIDLQFSVDPAMSEAKRRELNVSDVRVVIAPLNGKPAAVLMKPVDPTASKDAVVKYQSPVTVKSFDRVAVMKEAVVKARTTENGYVIEATIPLSSLGLKPAKDLKLRGDVGFISSDATGTINAARTYWSNKDTNLVSDLPHESWLTPEAWGVIEFQ